MDNLSSMLGNPRLDGYAPLYSCLRIRALTDVRQVVHGGVAEILLAAKQPEKNIAELLVRLENRLCFVHTRRCPNLHQAVLFFPTSAMLVSGGDFDGGQVSVRIDTDKPPSSFNQLFGHLHQAVLFFPTPAMIRSFRFIVNNFLRVRKFLACHTV